MLLLMAIVASALCYQSAAVNEAQLINKLLLNYDKRVRPVKNSSHSVQVEIEPRIYSLVDVDELHEMVKILLWILQAWTDENLSWDPNEWDNITLANVPASELWMPDGYIFNTIEIREALSLSQIYAFVNFNGMVEVDLSQVISFGCPMNLLSFPFDTQNCSLQFGSWGFQAHQLTHKVRNTLIQENHHNSEWDIISFNANKVNQQYQYMGSGNREFEEIFFSLRIKRKPLYYMIVMVIPSFVIVTVCLVGLFTPNSADGEHAEKVTLGLTTLLTMAVVLNIVASEMPKSSTGLPLLGRYILIEILICSCAIGVSVVILLIHQRLLSYNWAPPDWLMILMRMDKRKEAAKRSSNNLVDRHDANVPLFDLRNSQYEFADLDSHVRRCLEVLNDLKEQMMEQKIAQRDGMMWRRIFDKIDFIALLIFLVFNCVVSFLTFFWVATGLD